MRTVLKIALRGCLALACLLVLLYAADDLWARFQGQPVQQIKVDHVYAEVNHYNQVEYSAGTSAIETCIDALLPHFGHKPCWYLQRHTLQQTGP